MLPACKGIMVPDCVVHQKSSVVKIRAYIRSNKPELQGDKSKWSHLKFSGRNFSTFQTLFPLDLFNFREAPMYASHIVNHPITHCVLLNYYLLKTFWIHSFLSTYNCHCDWFEILSTVRGIHYNSFSSFKKKCTSFNWGGNKKYIS